jgi:glutamate/tyrosine decarboxylase-like PLP-dependent enzyme
LAEKPKVLVFGVVHPSIRAAAKMNGVNPRSVRTRMKRLGETLEQAIAHYLQRQRKEAAE